MARRQMTSTQAGRGDEVILGDRAHIYQNEMGAFTVLGGLHGRTVPNRDGMPDLEDISAAIESEIAFFNLPVSVRVQHVNDLVEGRAVHLWIISRCRPDCGRNAFVFPGRWRPEREVVQSLVLSAAKKVHRGVERRDC